MSNINLTSLVLRLPICTEICAFSMLTVAQCSFTDIPQCLCPNMTLQRDLTSCVTRTCNLTEQTVTSTIFQEELCAGVAYPSRSLELIHIATALIVISFLAIILRCISRYTVARKFWWDDWIMILAAVFMVPLSVFAILFPQYGFGRHTWNVPPMQIIFLRKIYYIVQILYVIIQALSKSSILLLYLRIFLDPGFRLRVKICLVWVAAHFLGFLVAVIFQCVPVKALWETDIRGVCVNSQALIYAGAAASILEDLVLVILPISELKTLNTNIHKKLALGFMFALGSFASVASMIRLKYLINFGFTDDASWDQVDVIIWSYIEVYTAILCACLICIRPLLIRWLAACSTSRGVQELPVNEVKPQSRKLTPQQISESASTVSGVKFLNGDEGKDRGNSFSIWQGRGSGLDYIELQKQ